MLSKNNDSLSEYTVDVVVSFTVVVLASSVEQAAEKADKTVQIGLRSVPRKNVTCVIRDYPSKIKSDGDQ